MSKLKNKWVLISVLSIISVLVIAYFSQGFVASWLTKETLESNVQISLLLQGDEGDLYESPVMLMSSGAYELKTEKDLAEGETTKDLAVRENLHDYVLAGVNIPKDPKVFITKKSGAEAYLYIEVIEDNFPKYFTEDGFEELAVDNESQNPNEVSPIYYYLEDFWVPVVQADGVTPATGLNGGKLYVYYNDDSYFYDHNKTFNITVGAGSEAKTLTQNATCLSSYIMKDESNDKIKKLPYYGDNEVKIVDGKPINCPSFNIIKDETIYVSEKYIHSEYYSTLYTDLRGKAENKSDTVKYGYDFGLYFNSYMASSKINGEYVNPFEAFAQAGFMDEEEYLIEQYRAKDTEEALRNDTSGTPKGELTIDGRVVYVWTEEELHIAVKDYFGDGKPYKIVLLRDITVNETINIPADTPSDFVFDMNYKTLSASTKLVDFFWYQRAGSYTTITGNGTFMFERNTGAFANIGDLIIENGNFIRKYDPTLDTDEVANDYPYLSVFVAVGSSTSRTYIHGGYFDNGYWCLEKDTRYEGHYTNTGLYPKYDTANGSGWLKDEDGNFIRGYFNKEDAHECFGPEPYGLLSMYGIGGGSTVLIYGGTFVGQNPAWGDEGCAQKNVDNPWKDVYYSNTQGYFLVGQGTLESAGVEYGESEIPGYTITEENTTYSYIDDDGNLVEFYVPKYTVKYNAEAAEATE